MLEAGIPTNFVNFTVKWGQNAKF